MLTLLVQYPDSDSKRIKVQDLKILSLEKVNADKVYSAVTGVLEDRSIPYSNLVSVLSDSCAVIRGCRSGFETQLRAKKANHFIDIDGDIHLCLQCHREGDYVIQQTSWPVRSIVVMGIMSYLAALSYNSFASHRGIATICV